MLESKIQAKVIKYLNEIGAKVINLKAATQKGNADLIICYLGMYVEFEMKQPGKDATKLQGIKGNDCIQAGGYWFVIHSLAEAKSAIAFLTDTKVIK